MKKVLWVLGNVYGKISGWSFLVPFHHAVINFSLHGLGYNNAYLDSASGEKWFIKKILVPSNPKIVFDIGANVGNYSRMLLAETNAIIYAIEPNPASFKKLNELSERVRKLNVAVADYDGKALLNFRGEYDERASLDKNIRQGEEVEVQVLRLDTIFCNEALTEVDYIKIDTEGFEKEALLGLGTLRPKFIQFEFNVHHLYKKCTLLEITELLPEYNFYRLLPNGWIKINPKKYLDNIFMFSNIVAVKKPK